MPNELRNVNIQFVSLVDKSANKKKFALIKSEDGKETFSNFCPIIKQDQDKQEITALVYEPGIQDSQGDYMKAEEIEKAQRTHAMNGFGADIQHSFNKEQKLHLVESWITKQDSKIGEQQIKKGTWMQTIFVEDKGLWGKIKKGEFTGFSMGGTGERISKQETPIINGPDKNALTKMLDFFKENLNIKKDNKKEAIKDMDEKKIQEMIDNGIKKAMNPAPTVEEQVAKALKKAGVGKEEKKVEKSEAPTEEEKIQKAVDGVLKAMGYEQKEETFEEKVAKAVAKAVDPMKKNIEKMATARGYTKSEENVTKTSNKNIDEQLKKSYLG